ncbi:unnamed protein product [Brassica oleracea var. botrytis]
MSSASSCLVFSFIPRSRSWFWGFLGVSVCSFSSRCYFVMTFFLMSSVNVVAAPKW